jgi:hypothetical protein
MTKTFSSFTNQNTKYFLTIDPKLGRATSCTCPDCQWRGRQCKHIKEFDAERIRVEKFNDLRKQFDCRLNGQADTQRCYFEMSLGA